MAASTAEMDGFLGFLKSPKVADQAAVNSMHVLHTESKGVLTTTVTNGSGLFTKSLWSCRLDKKKFWPTERYGGTVMAVRYVPEVPKKNAKGDDTDHTIVLDLDTAVKTLSYNVSLARALEDCAERLCERWNEENTPAGKAFNRSAKATEFILAVR